MLTSLRTIEVMCSAIRAAIQEAGSLGQIVTCRGSSLNPYLRKSVKEQFHPTPVRLPTIQSGGSTGPPVQHRDLNLV
jgi:hypothetical protein